MNKMGHFNVQPKFGKWLGDWILRYDLNVTLLQGRSDYGLQTCIAPAEQFFTANINASHFCFE